MLMKIIYQLDIFIIKIYVHLNYRINSQSSPIDFYIGQISPNENKWTNWFITFLSFKTLN